MARHLARRYARRGEPLDDLEQVALLALVKAVDRYDPERGVNFTTYGWKVVSGELKRHFRDTTWSLHVPRPIQELYFESKAATESLRSDLGRAPTVVELADYLGRSEEEVVTALGAGATYRLTSLDAPRRGDATRESEIQLGDPEPGFGRVEREGMVSWLLEQLSDDDRLVVRLYFFHGLSQAQIGARIGTSQMDVSRRLRRIVSRLRALAADPPQD
jgi:RNA polymerase sigma-B factor